MKALIFDFDGLIMDTEMYLFQAFEKLCMERGIQAPLELWLQNVGAEGHLFDPYGYVLEQSGETVEIDVIKQRHMALFDGLIGVERARPGVENYLKTAKQLGLKIGLASNSDRDWVTRFLRQCGLLEYFDCLCTAEEVERGKPDPALYLIALKKLQVEQSEAVAFEDSPTGVLAAKQAGLACVLVPNRLTENSSFEPVDLRLSSMEEMELDQLLIHCSRKRYD